MDERKNEKEIHFRASCNQPSNSLCRSHHATSDNHSVANKTLHCGHSYDSFSISVHMVTKELYVFLCVDETNHRFLCAVALNGNVFI
jgi:hypothetical protein